MRRIRHLEQCDYIVPIGQKINQVLSLSGQWNCYLERTWDQKHKIGPSIFASFNSGLMQGIKIRASLKRDSVDVSSKVETISVHRVADGTWAESFVSQKAPTLNGLVWECNFSQAELSSNELSGAETYLISVLFLRRRERYKEKVFFNHLGCFDSINRLRQEMERQKILGLLE